MELTKVNPKDFGLEETKAAEVAAMFKPMLDAMVELEQEFNEIALKEITEQTIKDAKELRLRFVKVRTGTAKIHRELKSFYLNGGRFVDAWKKAQLMASGDKEKILSEIENYFENQRMEELARLQEFRKNQIIEYLDYEAVVPNLTTMSEEVFENYKNGLQRHYEQVKEAEIKAKEEAEREAALSKRYEERKNLLIPVWNFVDSKDFKELSDDDFNKLLNKARMLKKKDDAEREAIIKENRRLEAERRKEAEARKLEEENRRLEAEQRKRLEEENRRLKEKPEAELKAKDYSMANMKVEDLITMLSKQDKKLQVAIQQGGDSGYMPVCTVKEMGLVIDNDNDNDEVPVIIICYND